MEVDAGPPSSSALSTPGLGAPRLRRWADMVTRYWLWQSTWLQMERARILAGVALRAAAELEGNIEDAMQVARVQATPEVQAILSWVQRQRELLGSLLASTSASENTLVMLEQAHQERPPQLSISKENRRRDARVRAAKANGVRGQGTSRQTSRGQSLALPSGPACRPCFVLEPRRPARTYSRVPLAQQPMPRRSTTV